MATRPVEVTRYLANLFRLRRLAKERGDHAAWLIVSGRIRAELAR